MRRSLKKKQMAARLLALGLSAAMILGAAGCGSTSTDDDTSETTALTTAETTAETEAAAEEAAETEATVEEAEETTEVTTVSVEAVTTIQDLTVNYEEDPTGVETDETVRFSWNMESNVIGQTQVSYQITIADAISGEEVYDTGTVESDDSTGIALSLEDVLEKETKYVWAVTVVTGDGSTLVSEEATFITDTDLSDADWIMPVQESGSMPLLRTEQELSGTVTSAYLYISALGIYTAYINGEEVTAGDADDIFAPGWTDYNSYVNYQTYDVTDYLDSETLVIGVELGNGWYAGTVGDDGGYEDVIGDEETCELALIAKLVITYEDGTEEVITTNESDWLSSDYSAVLANDYFDGETYDANIAKEIEGWNEEGYDTSSWSGVTAGTYVGELRSNSSGVGRVADEYTRTPVSAYIYNDEDTISAEEAGNDYGSIVATEVDATGEITLSAGDKLIIDMGQNAAGVVQFTVSGEQGTEVTLVHAEMLNDGYANDEIESGGSDGAEGTLYLTSITDAEVTDVYILSDDEVQTYAPSYTYHGFRYVLIEATADITLSDITGLVFTAVGDQTGVLETNNEEVNQLVSNTLWSQISNYLSIPTDCPQRGERAGWTGDAQLFAATGVYNYDVYAFLENYVDILQEYAENNGDIYGAIVPSAFVSFFATITASGWSDAGVIIPWVLYQQTGDITLIETSYAQMDAYMDAVAENGYSEDMFGDWLSYYPASTQYMNSVYQIYLTQIMSKMASALGYEEYVTKYDEMYEELKAAFLEKYVDEDGNVLSQSADGVTESYHGYTYVDNAQTALLWALKCGLYEDEDQRDIMIANLIANIQNEDSSIREDAAENTLSVGFLGVNVLLPVLTDIGAADVAYDLLLQTESPSWLYEVENGATTIWERWNSYSTENSFGDSSMNSFNHYSYGSCLEWMYTYMSGISSDEEDPGFKHIILQPTIDVDGDIDYVYGSYDSLYGTIVSEWSTEDGVLVSYHTVVPANTTATLYLEVEESAAEALEEITGVTYVGMTENNSETVAQFELEAGEYTFTLEDGVLSVSLADGYVVVD